MTTQINYQNYLKYANIQVAAEAFLIKNDGNAIDDKKEFINALRRGNGYNSVFTETGAKSFVEEWEVVTQQPNTSSGFSATLFKTCSTIPPSAPCPTTLTATATARRFSSPPCPTGPRT